MDMVVSRIRVLQENFVEVLPKTPQDLFLGNGVGFPPGLGGIGGQGVGARVGDSGSSLGGLGVGMGSGSGVYENDRDTGDSDFMDKIYDKEDNIIDSGGGGSGSAEAVDENITEDNATTEETVISNDIDELPVLTLQNINKISVFSGSDTIEDSRASSNKRNQRGNQLGNGRDNDGETIRLDSSRVVASQGGDNTMGAPPVTVVDDMAAVRRFSAAVRALSKAASSSSGHSSTCKLPLQWVRLFVCTLSVCTLSPICLPVCLSVCVPVCLILTIFNL